MLEIARGRTWEQWHTFMDAEDGPLSDLSAIVSVRSQIRKKTAVRNAAGRWEFPLVVEVTVTQHGLNNSQTRQSLTREQTDALEIGDYLIDMVGFDNQERDIVLLDPEVIKVIDRPTVGEPLILP